MSTASNHEAAMDMSAIDPGPGAAPQPTAPQPTAAQPTVQQATTPAGMWHPAQKQKFDPRRKSPVLAAVLSVLPGVGQVYIGYYARGFVLAAIFFAAVMTAGNSGDDIGPIFGMSALFLWVFTIIDAGRMAALYNHAAAGTDVIEMPEDFKLPSMGGSIVGGAVLVVFGIIALSNTAFGFSLDWVEVWWPLFPLALGAYLLARGVMDSTASPPARTSRYAIDEEPGGLDN